MQNLTSFSNQTEDAIVVDVLVIGCGMAGLTAAARAAQAGLSVLAIERAPEVGGSAVLSEGVLWTAASMEGMREHCGEGDVELQRAIYTAFSHLVSWIRDSGVVVTDQVRVLHGAGFRFDVASYMTWAKRTVERAGGSVLCSRVVDSLVQEDNIVVGARVFDRDGAVTVLARHTVLATGGFQGNSALMSDYFGSRSRQLLRRGNPYSAGDGLRLGLSVGGTASEGMDTFYGHLVPWPLPQYVESDFMRLVLFFSEHGFLFNLDGDRFTDETRGDHRNAQAVLAQPQARALLVFDAHVRDRHARTPLVSGSQTFDWVSESESAGAHVANSSTIEAIAEVASRWGYNGHSLARNLQQLRQSPTSKDCYHPLESSPFVAIEAKPAITFTEGGLRIDTKARVLNVSGSPVGGLYAAGADSGGVYNGGYAGGLAFAGAFGLLAAEEIVRSSRH